MNNDLEFTKKYNDCLKEYENDIPEDSSERSLNSELAEQNNNLQNANRKLKTKVAYLNTVVTDLERQINLAFHLLPCCNVFHHSLKHYSYLSIQNFFCL